jgi:hypothetical protein
LIYCEHENKKIISEDHAIHGIEHVGFSGMYRASGDVKKCKTSHKKKLITRIKEYQGQHDCVTLAKATIAHQIKTLGEDYQSGFKWSKDAIINIHLALCLVQTFIFSVKSNSKCKKSYNVGFRC